MTAEVGGRTRSENQTPESTLVPEDKKKDDPEVVEMVMPPMSRNLNEIRCDPDKRET